MKTTVLAASAVWSYKPRLFDSVSAALLEAIKEKFKFKSAPSIEQVTQNPQGPYNFLLGTFTAGDRKIIIEQFLVNYVGVTATAVSAATKTSTDDADAFLAEVQRMGPEYQVDATKIAPDYHQSVLEAIFERPISAYFTQIRRLSESITSTVKGYGFECQEFEMAGFSLQADPTANQPPNVGPFSIERRVGAPFSENRYFCQAPLRTTDHVKILREIEFLLRP